MGNRELRKKIINIEAEVVDVIPNDRSKAQKIVRTGSSYSVVIPSGWAMHFDDEIDTIKVLCRLRVPALGRIMYIYTHAMLVIGSDDFPLEKMVK